jgi:TPR repeat protein
MRAFIGCVLLCGGTVAQSAGPGSLPAPLDRQMLSEQRHFIECLACVYSPAWWLSYNGSLYFQPRNEAQARELETMKAVRSKYVALTNQAARHDLAAKLIAASGIRETWQRQILLPLSATNGNLTPTLNKPLCVVPGYKVLRSFPNGDALIQDDASTYFVMDFGRGADDAACTNAVLVREGEKTYAAGDRFKTVGAFADVALNKEETAMLNRVVAACQQQAAILGRELADSRATQDFEDCKARASDSNPYMEYLLAKAYLEGKGTEKDARLGWEWMNRAARSGSGDAQSYLEASKRKAP